MTQNSLTTSGGGDKPKGVIAKLAANYFMDPEAFEVTLVRTIFPNKGDNATKEQVAALCIVADQYGLNPLTKQIYAFENQAGGITPVIGVDGWYSLMNRHEQFDGITFREVEDENGNPLKVYATIHRKDTEHPIEVSERFSECRRNTGPWNTQPWRMLRHRAAIQAIRMAFGVSALDPEDVERIPEFEVQSGAAEAAKRQRKEKDAARDLANRYGVPDDEDVIEVEGSSKPAEQVEAEPEPEPEVEVEVEVEQGEPEPEPEPDDDDPDPFEEEKTPKRKKRRTRATKEQREKFRKAMARGWVDPSKISPDLPDTEEDVEGKRPKDDTIEAAFDIMFSEDAEKILEGIKAKRYFPDPRPEPEEPDDPSGGQQGSFADGV